MVSFCQVFRPSGSIGWRVPGQPFAPLVIGTCTCGGSIQIGHAIVDTEPTCREKRAAAAPSQSDYLGLEDDSVLVGINVQRTQEDSVEHGVNGVNVAVWTVTPLAWVAGFALTEHHLRLVDMPANQEFRPVDAFVDRGLQFLEPATRTPIQIVVSEQSFFNALSQDRSASPKSSQHPHYLPALFQDLF